MRHELLISLALFLGLSTSVLGQNIVLTKGLDLQLDEETAYPFAGGSTFQYCRDFNAVAYFNKLTNSIKYFYYETGKTISQTKFEKFGPNAPGTDIIYVHYHNKDSIFVLSDFDNFRIHLMNSEGEKQNTYELAGDQQFSHIQIPKVSRIFGAVVIVGKELFLAVQISSIAERNKVSPIIRLNLENGSFTYLKSPRPYENLDIERVVWSSQYNLYETRIALTRKGELLINFPLEHDYYSYHIESGELRVLSGKNTLIGDFKFLTENRSKLQSTGFLYKDMIYNTAWYQGVLFDSYNHLIYRIGRVEGDSDILRRSISGENVKRIFEYAVSVFDENFNLLDEAKFTSKQTMFERGLFLGPDGLFVVEPNLKGEGILGMVKIELKK